jgi:hypothetical protein
VSTAQFGAGHEIRFDHKIDESGDCRHHSASQYAHVDYPRRETPITEI